MGTLNLTAFVDTNQDKCIPEHLETANSDVKYFNLAVLNQQTNGKLRELMEGVLEQRKLFAITYLPNALEIYQAAQTTDLEIVGAVSPASKQELLAFARRYPDKLPLIRKVEPTHSVV